MHGIHQLLKQLFWVAETGMNVHPSLPGHPKCTMSCFADDVEVTGLVQAEWRPLFPGARCDGTLTMRSCAIRSINSRHRAAVAPAEGLQEMFRYVPMFTCIAACR